jgi:hypothetical protein
MKTAIMAALLICVAFVSPAAAQHTIAGEYDLLTGLWAWEATAARQLTGWLSVGYSLTVVCDGAIYKAGLVPSWAPVRQDYSIWAEVRHGAWSLRVTDWCNHWLAQSGRPPWADEWGLTLRVQWEW